MGVRKLLSTIRCLAFAVLDAIGQTTRIRGASGRFGEGDYSPESRHDYGYRVTHPGRYD
jgi:hypothetical protein